MLWASGFILQLKLFVRTLHAAMSPKPKNSEVVSKERILVDASPWGGGAVRLVDDRPVETFALACWTAEDE